MAVCLFHMEMGGSDGWSVDVAYLQYLNDILLVEVVFGMAQNDICSVEMVFGKP